MQIAEAFVAVRADVNQSRFRADVQRGIETPLVAGSKQAGKKAGDAAGNELNKALEDRARQTQARIASLFGTALFVRGVRGAIEAASQLQEQTSATGQIFGEAADEVDEFAKGAADALGQSEAAARKAVNSFGALFRSFGTSETQAAQFGITLDTLASDLASFRDTPIEEAFLALQSGLVGEAEPLRRFGVSLSEARLQAEALNLGLVEQGTKTLPAAAKAQAALSIIIQDTKLAQGDFNRTRDSAANTEKRVAAELANTSAQLGQSLLPAYQRLTEIVGQLARAFGGLPGPLQVALVALAGLAVAARPLRDAGALVGVLSGKVTELGKTAPKTAAAIRGIGIAGGAATAVLALSQAIGALDDEASASVTELTLLEEKIRGVDAASSDVAIAQALGQDLVQFGNDVKTVFDTFEDASGTQKITEGVNSFLGGLTGVESGAENARRRVENLDKVFASLAASNLPLAEERFASLTNQLKEQGVTTEELESAFPLYEAALASADNAQQDAAASANVYDVNLRGLDDSATSVAAKIKDLAESLFAPTRAADAAADALQGVRDAQAELAELRETAAGRGPQQAAALQRIADAERRVSDAVETHAEAVRRVQEAREELAEFEGANEARIRELERAQIVERQIDTAEEARQKEIDLLRFDQGAAEERERLQGGIADAEEGVQEAAEGVRDAQKDVADANRQRRDDQLEAAAQIAEAERGVNEAVLGIVDSYAQVVEKEGEASLGALALKGAIDQVRASAAGISPALVDALARLATAQVTAPNRVGRVFTEHGALSGFATGGVVSGPVGRPQLAVVHGGEEVLTPAQRASGGSVSVNQNVTFVGGDIPTVTQLDALNRKTAIRVRNMGRKP